MNYGLACRARCWASLSAQSPTSKSTSVAAGWRERNVWRERNFFDVGRRRLATTPFAAFPLATAAVPAAPRAAAPRAAPRAAVRLAAAPVPAAPRAAAATVSHGTIMAKQKTNLSQNGYGKYM